MKAVGAQLIQLFILSNGLVDMWVPIIGKPGEVKLWKLGCHSGFVSRRNIFISTTGSKAYMTEDESLQLRAAIACATILPNYKDRAVACLSNHLRSKLLRIIFIVCCFLDHYILGWNILTVCVISSLVVRCC